VTTNLEKIGETTETMARTTQESVQTVMDYAVKTQEINTRVLQRMTEVWIDGFRRQTELSQELVQEIFEKGEDQAEAYQKFFGQWETAFKDFPSVGTFPDPLAFQREGMRLVESAARGAETAATNGGFPIAGYDEMNVAEVGKRLDGLNDEQIRRVRDYEKRNKNRETLIEQFDRKLKATS
jgi:hypothetical protein